MTILRPSLLAAALLATVSWVACGGDDNPSASPSASGGAGGTGGGGTGSPDQTGAVCKVATDCYPGLEAGAMLSGAALCLDRVREGYCTHECGADADCCAAKGECKTTLSQVCSPFESTGKKMCFLSCESGDIGSLDDQTFCQKEASTSFICRSSGGGQKNRKICVPGNCGAGAGCSTDANCAAGLTCITTLRGGYCGKPTCAADADCGNGAQCVKHSDGKNYCFRTCTGDSDCSFCRPAGLGGSCSDQVTFAEAGKTGRVCLPPP